MILKRKGAIAYNLFWEHPSFSDLSHRRLSLPEWFSLSLSLNLSQESCIRVPSLCILYLSCTLLGPSSIGMAMSILHFLYPSRPYPWNVGNVYFIFLLCLIALCMMYICVCVYIYIYIYMPLCVWVIMHFVWWTLMVMWVTFSGHVSTPRDYLTTHHSVARAPYTHVHMCCRGGVPYLGCVTRI